MILLRDKSFSSNAQLKRPTHVAELQTIGFIKEVIKLIEFYDKQHNMVHWIRQEIVGRYFRETLRARHLITDCFVRAVEDENTKNKSARIRFDDYLWHMSCGDDAIREVFGQFKKGRSENNKYSKDNSDILKVMKPDIDLYRRALKYMALSYSGQIDPRKIPFYDPLVDELQVDYMSREVTNTRGDFAYEIFIECLVNIKGYPTDEISRILGTFD